MKPEPVEPVLKLLTALMVFFTLALFACERFFSSDTQVFQVICGLLTAISGAFMMRVKPAHQGPDVTGSVTTSKTVSVLQPEKDITSAPDVPTQPGDTHHG